MNTDGNIHALNQHIGKMEQDDMRDEAIEEKSIEFHESFKAGLIVHIDGTHYSLDDFIADFEIDSCYFAEMLNRDVESMASHANEKLIEWCDVLAAIYVDNRED